MKVKLVAVLLGLLFTGAIFANEPEGKDIGLLVGIETGYGNILGYFDEFGFWIKPNIEWDVLKSGFSVGLGWVIPVHPAEDTEIEIGEGYGFSIGDSNFELSFGNVNALSISSPSAVSGFVSTGVGYKWISLDGQLHYLSNSEIGFYGFVFVPAIAFEIQKIEIGVSLEIGVWTGEEVSFTVEPVLGVSYTF